MWYRTRVPIADTLTLLRKIFDLDTVKLFHHVLTTTYFVFEGRFYEQSDGVAMGSPLSPAIANFYMEDFEERALESAPLRPKFFFRYVDDTFVVWPHGIDTLDSFLTHMNGLHPNIRFTMEIEKDGELPFLDILVYKKQNGGLGHKVYRKPTHTNLYLNGGSHHHPAQKQAVISSLIHRARNISDDNNLPGELRHLKETFLQNGYGRRDISTALKRAFSQTTRNKEEKERPTATALLPYVSTVSGKISRILSRHNIRTIHLPPKKIRSSLFHPKDPAGLKVPGVYRIQCECGEVYIGETSRTIETRVKEHRRHLRLSQPEKSAVAEHAIDEDHAIKWEATERLCHGRGFWDRVVKEAIEIKTTKFKTFNRDTGFHLSATWNPLMKRIRR